MDTKGKFVKETTTMAIYKHLQDLILTGHFSPGEWIRERQLKELLGVSSTPIREALRMLVQERILISVPHHGVHVKRFTIKEIKDFYEVRSELEGLAAELAATNGESKQFEEIGTLLELAELNITNNTEDEAKLITYNNEFHHLVAIASTNEALVQSLKRMRTEINLLRVMSWKTEKQRPKLTLNQHKLVFEAIAGRNPPLARERMKKHIGDSAALVLKVAEEFQKEEINNLFFDKNNGGNE